MGRKRLKNENKKFCSGYIKVEMGSPEVGAEVIEGTAHLGTINLHITLRVELVFETPSGGPVSTLDHALRHSNI